MPLCGNAYKISVTGLAFCVIWHSKHSADWLAALASPYPASPDFPRKRGQNKTPRNTLFINGSTVSTGYSAPACGGKAVAPATKGGRHFLARRAVVWFSPPKAAFILASPRAPTLPAQRCYITPEGGALNPSGRRQPVPDRTLGAQGQRPGGAINPRGEAASTFGNTGKHRPGPDPDRAASAPISSVPRRSRGADRYTLQ